MQVILFLRRIWAVFFLLEMKAEVFRVYFSLDLSNTVKYQISTIWEMKIENIISPM